jgi:hypothetical protein
MHEKCSSSLPNNKTRDILEIMPQISEERLPFIAVTYLAWL